jgi:hypothetical protein
MCLSHVCEVGRTQGLIYGSLNIPPILTIYARATCKVWSNSYHTELGIQRNPKPQDRRRSTRGSRRRSTDVGGGSDAPELYASPGDGYLLDDLYESEVEESDNEDEG